MGGRNNGVDKPFMITTKKHFHYKDGGVSIRDGKRVMFRCLDMEMNKVKVLNFVLKK